jgi:hypothetical protein
VLCLAAACGTWQLQIVGESLFLWRSLLQRRLLEQRKLASGELRVTDEQPVWRYTPIVRLAQQGTRIFGVSRIEVEFGTGWILPSALYELRATGSEGTTVLVLDGANARIFAGEDDLYVEAYQFNGCCGGHGNTCRGVPPSRSWISCFAP